MIKLFSVGNARVRKFSLVICLLPALLLGTSAVAKPALVSKWGRFEQSFDSSVKYENPPQQCTLQVIFVSPHGETNSVYGFWDGGKTWRVRFSPNLPGRWTYRTACSDANNKRLDNQAGEFLCSSPIGQNRFAQHGPVQVARDHRHFEHADGTPFFWLADAAWNGPRMSNPKDWTTYAQTRAGQNFSAVQWAAAPGVNAQQQSAFSGKSKISINPEFFRQLDIKVEALNRAGLLSVIIPLWGNDNAINDLPEEQITLLIRYMTARWGAYNVAWLLATDGTRNARWERIGHEVFANTQHAPVIVFSGELTSAFDEFRNEAWADAFGFGLGQNMNDDSLKWLISGPLVREWKNQPARPLINVLPPLENGLAAQSHDRITASDVRRVTWWSLLLAPTAGVTYGAQDVANWNTSLPTPQPKVKNHLPIWQLSLFLPGAKQTAQAGDFFRSTDFWQLHPASRSLAIQPGRMTPRRFIASAETEDRDLSLNYVPEDRTLELFLETMPPSPGIQWLNPRTGQKTPAVAVVGSRTCQLPTPEAGDWVLVMKNGK